MGKSRIIFFLIGVSVLILFFIIYVLLTGKNPIAPSQEQPTPTPISGSYPGGQEILRIISVYPEEKYLKSLAISSTVTIELNDSIDPTSLDYEINPTIVVITRLDQSATKLSFRPKSFWKPDQTYTLIIKKVKSQLGSSLGSEYKLEFKAIVTRDEEASGAETKPPNEQVTPAL
ncbi:MAG: hypothetical protein HYT08_03195 [Candidatus Levybacteria bacterium]|nr:hypothetical protein [Candidatus Levybacteria bacterium]